MLDGRLELARQEGLSLIDQWLDLAVRIEWSKPAALWCHPVETVSQSEGGFEKVYQSSAVIPHWFVSGDEAGRWELGLRWSVSRASRQASDSDTALVEAHSS
jgi:alpha-amylase